MVPKTTSGQGKSKTSSLAKGAAAAHTDLASKEVQFSVYGMMLFISGPCLQGRRPLFLPRDRHEMTSASYLPRVLFVVGARPNFIKAAPLIRAMWQEGIACELVHTGQHYDQAMSEQFFRDLELPLPDVNLGVGSATHSAQTAQIMLAFEPVLVQRRPDLVLVVGDVNSTLAAALVAAKNGVPIGHVESGLRSFDRSMPEEINRILTDQVSDLLFTTCADADENLRREGIDPAKIHFVGNVMIDALNLHREKAASSGIRERLNLKGVPYAVLTLHRPNNVDSVSGWEGILRALREIQNTHAIVFPIHPRSLKNLKSLGLETALRTIPNLKTAEPLGYIDFIGLMMGARFILTDSGGIQEETTALGLPCLTLRENTERPITVTEGTNALVGSDPDRILAAVNSILDGKGPQGRIPRLWDGQASPRIVKVLAKWHSRKGTETTPAPTRRGSALL